MKITCPECSERFDVSSDMIGKKAKCGECAHVFVVPDLAEKKARKVKSIESSEEMVDVRQTTWLSLYLAGLAVGMLLIRGHQGGMVASILFGLAIETAALFLVWRGFWNVWLLKEEKAEAYLVKTAILVCGILMGLLVLSVLLTLYALIAGPSAGGLGGLGSGLGDMMKNLNEINKLAK